MYIDKFLNKVIGEMTDDIKKGNNTIDTIFNLLLKAAFLYVFSFIAGFVFDRVILQLIALCINACSDELLILDSEIAHAILRLSIFRYFSKAAYFSLPRIYFFSIFFFLFLMIKWCRVHIVYKYRYFFAGIVLFMLVLGKFTGSSLGYYDGLLLDNTDKYTESTLLGIPQGLRGDEFATEKPYYFAQESVNYEYFNKNVMMGGADMIVSAFAPVKDPIIIARPDLWGFLFLPRDYAFSFYWNVRIILLFMASFELAHLLTQRKKYGLIWAILVCFAPPIQWWLSQAFMIIIWSGEYFIVTFDKILKQRSKVGKLFFSIMTAWFGIIYIMTMYPAVQVPMGYVFAGLLAYIIISNLDHKPFGKYHLCCYFLMILIIGIYCIYFYTISGSSLNVMMNTIYPGKSRNWLQLNWDYDLLKLVNPVMWCNYLGTINNCEASQFFSFFPFTIILLIFYSDKKDKNVLLAKIITIICGILWLISYLPENLFFNKITMLSFSYPVRILLASGFGGMLALLIMVCNQEKNADILKENKKKAIIISIIYFAILFLLTMNSDLMEEYFGNGILGRLLLIIFIVIYIYMGYLLLRGGKKFIKRFSYFIIGISIISTSFINPITYGTDSMFEKIMMKEIREIAKEDPTGRWMVSGNTTIANLVMAQGVARVSGTYYYPDVEMMEVIDPKHKYENFWNQYAHIDMRLTEDANHISSFDEERGIKTTGVDRIVYIDMETAKKLNIKYIFASNDLISIYEGKDDLEKIYENTVDNWTIYKVIY